MVLLLDHSLDLTRATKTDRRLPPHLPWTTQMPSQLWARPSEDQSITVIDLGMDTEVRRKRRLPRLLMLFGCRLRRLLASNARSRPGARLEHMEVLRVPQHAKFRSHSISPGWKQVLEQISNISSTGRKRSSMVAYETSFYKGKLLTCIFSNSGLSLTRLKRRTGLEPQRCSRCQSFVSSWSSRK